MATDWYGAWDGAGPGEAVLLEPIDRTKGNLPGIRRGNTYAEWIDIPATEDGTLALIAKQKPYAESREDNRADVWIDRDLGLVRIARRLPTILETGSIEIDGTRMTVRLSAAATAAISNQYPLVFEVRWTYGGVTQTIHDGEWSILGGFANPTV